MDTNDKIVQVLQKLEAGTCTPQELEWLNTWYEQEAPADVAGNLPAQEEMLHAIHERIAPARPEEEAPSIRHWWRLAAAAVLAALLAGGYWGYTSRQQQQHRMLVVETGPGQQREVILPDSTHVWLNAGARLEYPQQFGETRVVTLSGQGFFDVKADIHKPFEVKTAELNIRVLGTSFDVKAYPSLDEAQVSVKSGSVKVSRQEEGLDVLNVGDQLIYSRAARQHMKSKVNYQHIDEWATGMISLSEAGFAELAITLENQYGVRIRYNPSEMRKDEYTLRCSSKLTVLQVLDIVSSIHPIQYDVKGNEITVSRK